MRKPAKNSLKGKREPEQPTWFQEKDYAYLRDLDAVGWHQELLRLYDLNLGLVGVLPNGGRVPPPQTVQFIRPSEEGFRLEPDRLPALIVTVNAPDAVILSQIKETLELVPRQFRPSIAKPGRAALNSVFDERIFAMWRRERIVPLADLLAWRANLPKGLAKDYPDHLLGMWVGKDTPRTTSEAKEKLKEALACLPALAAQIAQPEDAIDNILQPADFFEAD